MRDAVADAVRRQMVSDVPLGSFLSGGIDSSAIVAAMTAATDRSRPTPSASREEDLAHEIVPDDIGTRGRWHASFDLDYHERILEPDIVDLLPKLVWHMDEPVADPAAITTYMICRRRSERLTVILSGMGGDEVFAGYPRHLAARIGPLADLRPAAARGSDARVARGTPDAGQAGPPAGARGEPDEAAARSRRSPAERYLTYSSYYRPERARARA